MVLPMKLLPELWLSDAFIAGGYAACPALAGDVDVWVTVPIGNSLGDVRDELLDHLSENGFKFTAQPGPTETNAAVCVEPEYDVPFMSKKVAMVQGWQGVTWQRPYHIIVTNGNIDEVLAGFDISTHQVGLHPERGTVKGANWTDLNELPVVLRDTPNTQERMLKITDRYRGYRATQDAELRTA